MKTQNITQFTHQDMMGLLNGRQGASIVEGICRLGGHGGSSPRFMNDTPRFRAFSEITLIEPEWNGTEDRFGREKHDHLRMDAVLSILPARDSLNQGGCLMAGIELKGSESDLKDEDELQRYLLWFDYTFVGVPTALVPAARAKLNEEGLDGTVGIVDVEAGSVVEMAERHSVDSERALRVLQRIQINYLFGDSGGNVIEVHVSGGDKSPDVSDSVPGDLPMATPVDATDAAERAALLKERRRKMREQAAADGESLPDAIRTPLAAMPPKAQQAYHAIAANPGVQAPRLMQELDTSEPAIRRHLAELIKAGLIEHRGTRSRGGYYPVHDAADVADMRKCRDCIVIRKLGLNLGQLFLQPDGGQTSTPQPSGPSPDNRQRSVQADGGQSISMPQPAGLSPDDGCRSVTLFARFLAFCRRWFKMLWHV